jgi:ribosome modulation factor
MTDAEKTALSEQREAEHLGRVAVYHGKARDVCPYAEGPRRDLWLKSYDATASRGITRPDMCPAMGSGYLAFQDGLHQNECPYPSGSQSREDWREGWEKAQRAKEKDDERYR